MRFEVPEHRGDLRSSREESGEDVGRDLREGEVVTLSIKHVDDLIEAHEITRRGADTRHGRPDPGARRLQRQWYRVRECHPCECNAHSDRAGAPSPGIRPPAFAEPWRLRGSGRRTAQPRTYDSQTPRPGLSDRPWPCW